MTNYNPRSVTQEDINNSVSSSVSFWSGLGGPIDWDVIFAEVFDTYTRMRSVDAVNPIYDLEGMINNAIGEYN